MSSALRRPRDWVAYRSRRCSACPPGTTPGNSPDPPEYRSRDRASRGTPRRSPSRQVSCPRAKRRRRIPTRPAVARQERRRARTEPAKRLAARSWRSAAPAAPAPYEVSATARHPRQSPRPQRRHRPKPRYAAPRHYLFERVHDRVGVGVKSRVTQFERVAARERLQIVGQTVFRRHDSAFDQHRDHRDVAPSAEASSIRTESCSLSSRRLPDSSRASTQCGPIIASSTWHCDTWSRAA